MPKLTVEKLKKIREEAQKRVADIGNAQVIVHMGTCGIASGAKEILDSLMREIKAKKLNGIKVKTTGCAGLCSKEPMVTVELPGNQPVKYANLTGEKMKTILEEHVLGHTIVSKYALAIGNEQIL
jgi:NADP-reducing hydrogenase subunit HndB